MGFVLLQKDQLLGLAFVVTKPAENQVFRMANSFETMFRIIQSLHDLDNANYRYLQLR
jgi:hypothetical protein